MIFDSKPFAVYKNKLEENRQYLEETWHDTIQTN